MIKPIHLIFLCLIFLSACHSSKQSLHSSPEAFLPFYERFHQDSLFQVQRVLFPLDGYSIEGGRITSWSLEDWAMHKNGLNNIDTAVYKTERIEHPGKIKERIYQPHSGVLIERQFSLVKNKWFLSLYLYIFL